MSVLREITEDAVSIARTYCGEAPSRKQYVETLSHDGSVTLMLSRVAQAAHRSHLPLYGALRRVQMALYGIEISKDVTLGRGVVFVHTAGIVIGGDSRIGDRVMFLGSNTIGSVGRTGYPRIGNDVVIGAGARILGGVTIGDRAAIGANAVVLCDVPAGAVAVGVPAVVRVPESRAK